MSAKASNQPDGSFLYINTVLYCKWMRYGILSPEKSNPLHSVIVIHYSLGYPLVLLEGDDVLRGPAHQVLQQDQRLVEALQDQHEVELGVQFPAAKEMKNREY